MIRKIRKPAVRDEILPIPGRNLVIKTEWDNGNLMLATRKGRPIGSLWWAPTGKYTLRLEHLDVASQYQNQGLGGLLVRTFLCRLPQLYPHVRYLTAHMTSRAVFRLTRRYLGRPLDHPDVSQLAEYAPTDWLTTHNRLLVRFKLTAKR